VRLREREASLKLIEQGVKWENKTGGKEALFTFYMPVYTSTMWHWAGNIISVSAQSNLHLSLSHCKSSVTRDITYSDCLPIIKTHLTRMIRVTTLSVYYPSPAIDPFSIKDK
jgi:hypothetical protein